MKRFLGVLVFLFLLVIFVEQNTAPVPLKFFVGSPFYVNLSLIIGLSLLAGAALTILSVVVYKDTRLKRRMKKSGKAA